MDAVLTDLQNVRQGLVKLGVNEADIIVHNDADFATFSKLLG